MASEETKLHKTIPAAMAAIAGAGLIPSVIRHPDGRIELTGKQPIYDGPVDLESERIAWRIEVGLHAYYRAMELEHILLEQAHIIAHLVSMVGQYTNPRLRK